MTNTEDTLSYESLHTAFNNPLFIYALTDSSYHEDLEIARPVNLRVLFSNNQHTVVLSAKDNPNLEGTFFEPFFTESDLEFAINDMMMFLYTCYSVYTSPNATHASNRGMAIQTFLTDVIKPRKNGRKKNA